MTSEYHDSWTKYAEDVEKKEKVDAAVEKDRKSMEAFRDATQPRMTGYEFRTGHRTQFPEIKVLDGENDEQAAYRVAGERRQAGVEEFKEGSIWGAQQAVDAWAQGLLALERLKNLRKYKPLRNVSAAAGDGAGGPRAAADAAEEEAESAPDPSDEAVVELSVVLRLNVAQALLKLKEYQACISHCDKALEYHPSSLKALWRKAQAVWGIRNPGLARETLERLLELDEGNPAAVALLREIEQEEQRRRVKRTGVKGASTWEARVEAARHQPRPARPRDDVAASAGGAGEEKQDSEAEDDEEDGADEEDIGFWAGFFVWLGKLCCRRRQKQE